MKWICQMLVLLVLLTGCGAEKQVLGGAELEEAPKYVALTFDDGPRRETTERLLDGLKQRGVSATFFLVGERIPGQEDLVRRMQMEGHQIGNHTWSHVRLAELSPEEAKEEIGHTDRLLRKLLGEGWYWLRPPYGQIDRTEGLSVPVVRWNVDPRDWESLDRKAVTEAVLKHAEPNSIILLHDIYESSVEAALDIADALQEQGYWFVTVEELLKLNGVTAEPGHLYSSGRT